MTIAAPVPTSFEVRNVMKRIDFVIVPSSIKYRKLIAELLERLVASNPTAVLQAHATGSSISNEVTLEIDSHSDSITESICTQKPLSVAEEPDKVIKEGYAPMQAIRFETLSSKIQTKCLFFENGGRRGDYLGRKYSYLMTIKPTSVESE
ncbi:hypothetical protein TNCV_3259331 [Trichonephila clavipes]|nr:hypothetical protein TNCV_3259331 [Trichonephila clavipes]